MNNVSVSIIVPVYNVEKYLKKAIDSLLNQSADNYEIILVDDGSTDNSGKICDSYISDNVTVIHQKNSGVSAARNAALKIAKGKFILFCDSDDYVDKNFVELLTAPLRLGQTELTVSGYSTFNDYDSSDYSYVNFESDKFIKPSGFYSLKQSNTLHFLWNKGFCTDIIRNNNILFDESLDNCEDLCFILEYLRYIKSDILLISKCLYFYYIRQGSATHKYYDDLFTNLRRRYFIEYEKTLLKLNYDSDKLKIFYRDYFISFIECICNTFDKRNKLSLFKKIALNHKIVTSEEYNRCYNEMDKSGFVDIYLKVCKSRCALLILAFIKITNLKK